MNKQDAFDMMTAINRNVTTLLNGKYTIEQAALAEKAVVALRKAGMELENLRQAL